MGAVDSSSATTSGKKHSRAPAILFKELQRTSKNFKEGGEGG
jgi:hypothetical protein